ncbi:MAG: hypothetical protein GY851_00345 [bacterium]|nr:hypothetical protein [bacterium]
MSEDTPPAGSQTDEGVGEGAATEPDGAKPDETPFLKTATSTYKSPEDAVKGFDESQKALSRVQQEKHDLKQQLEQAQSLASIAKTIEKQTAPQGESADDREARIAKITQEVADDPGRAVALILEQDQVQQAEVRKLREELVESNKKRDEAYDLKIGELAVNQNPVYQKHREQVEEAQTKYGVDRDTAIKIVADNTPDIDQPDRQAPPGTTGGLHRPPTEQAITQEVRASMRQSLVDNDVDPESTTGKEILAEMEAEHKAKAVA